MHSQTLLLMRLYWRLDRRADGGIGRFGWVSRAMLFAVIIALSAFLGVAGSSFVVEDMPDLRHLEVIPGLLLALVLLGTTFSGFNQALQALYLSDDLEKLLVAPLPARSIVTAKLLGRLPTTVLLTVTLVTPALLAFGVVLGLGAPYYVLGVILVLAAPLFGISVGAIIAILLVRLMPARRLSEWMGAAAIIAGTLLSMVFYLPHLLSGGDEVVSAEAEMIIAGALNSYAALPLPTNWAGKALIDLGKGSVLPSDFSGLLAYLLITVGLFLITIFMADRLYLSGWLRLQSSGGQSHGLEDEPGIFGGGSLDMILGYKDWLLRIRDRRLLATLFSGLISAGFLAFILLLPEEGGSAVSDLADEFSGDDPISAIFSTGVLISGLIYFISWLSFSRIAASALSIERGAAYILRSAPIRASRVMRAKVYGILIPFMGVVSLLLIGGLFVFGYSALWTPFAWLVMLIMGFGVISYAVSLDFVYPNLDWEDPRKMTNRKAGWPSLLGTVLYSMIAGAVAMTTFGFAVADPPLAIPTVLLGLGLLAGGTWFFVARRIDRVEAAWSSIGEE